MDLNSLMVNPAVWGVIGSVLTGFIAYRTALKKDSTELYKQREAYVDQHLRDLLESYQVELGELKGEIKALTAKNQQLVEEVISLKAKIMELEGANR